MSHWLLKTEPADYSWSDLVKDKKTIWSGVANALALKHIRSMKRGDLALIYHTGKERQIIGIAQITSNPYPDPNEKDERLVVVDLKPLGRFQNPVPLTTIRSDPAFKSWDLLRNSRLSVMPVPDEMWMRIDQFAKGQS
jgi:predicted RNA-binding protein with PUA-like domain